MSSVLFYEVVEWPVSPLLLLASEEGLRRVVFLKQQHPEEWLLENAASQATVGLPDRLAGLAGRLQAYLRGSREDFADVPLDLAGATPFQQRVWKELQTVPYGTVVTYGELAWKIGKPTAARAVGNAVGANRVPIIIPCHRVVAAGGVGGFGQTGVAIKRALLKLEGVKI